MTGSLPSWTDARGVRDGLRTCDLRYRLSGTRIAAALCARVVVLRAGRVVADGTPTNVFTQALADQVFGPGLRVLDGLIPPAVVPRP